MSIQISLWTIAGFFLYHAVFVNIAYIPNYTVFIAGAVLACFLCAIKHFKKVFYYKFQIINLIVFVYILLTALTAFKNEKLFPGTIYSSSLYIFQVLALIIILEESVVNKTIEKIISVFYKLTFVYCIITDVLVFAKPNLANINNQNYLVGTKFNVAYFHIFLIVFYLYFNGDKIRELNRWAVGFYLSILWSFIISLRVDCSTGTIGTAVILVLFFLKDWNWGRPGGWLATLVVCDTTLLFYNTVILSNVHVRNFITNVLHRSTDLTGRVRIYMNIWPVIFDSPLLGYGINNYYTILIEKIAAPNAQNGVLNLVIQSGILGAIAYILLAYYCIAKSNYKKAPAFIFIMLYMTVLSSVEITLSLRFLVFAVLLFFVTFEKDDIDGGW